MLQPPLEALLDGTTMEFPFEPFCFQYAGVAFLYPRYHAILADEMGLGKTMQAITAIRMLLRTGQIKTFSMICPKPLGHQLATRISNVGPGNHGGGHQRQPTTT